jgi:hypothetical protein
MCLKVQAVPERIMFEFLLQSPERGIIVSGSEA